MINLSDTANQSNQPCDLLMAAIPEPREKTMEIQDIARAPVYRLAMFFGLSLSPMREAGRIRVNIMGMNFRKKNFKQTCDKREPW